MVSKQKILIVDDDNNIAELISLYLVKECFETKICNDGETAINTFDTFKPNLVLLDLMLPGIDGYQVCRELRTKSQVPVIMLSAKGEVFDKVLGLEMGADDYMEKPFDSKELVARVKAVLRRYKPQVQEVQESDDKVVRYPDLEINMTNSSIGRITDHDNGSANVTRVEEMTYQVDDVSVILPEDSSSLGIVPGKDYCTLMTCTPYGINTHRLLVRGVRVENDKELVDVRVTADALKIEPLYVVPFIAGPVLLLMILWVALFAGKKRKSRYY